MQVMLPKVVESTACVYNFCPFHHVELKARPARVKLSLRTQNSDIFLFNPFDTLSKLLLQIYTYMLKYGLGRHLLRQNICR